MELKIKQLKQNNQIFIPLTTAEAVLVKQGTEVRTLKKVLDTKIDTVITGSGLQVTPSGPTLYLKHTNTVEPVAECKPLQLSFDDTGHVSGAKPLGKLTIVVGDKKAIDHDGTQDNAFVMGDDFTLDDQVIKLNWTNL